MAVFYADMKIFLMLVLLYWLLYGTIKRLRLKTCFVRKKKLLSHIRRHRYAQFFLKVKYNSRKIDYI